MPTALSAAFEVDRAMEFLERMCDQVRKRVAQREAEVPLGALRRRVEGAPSLRPFRQAVTVEGEVSLIAELKQASPSRGLLRTGFDIPSLARPCERGGARALSVLTEPDFFRGSLAYLEAARLATALPVLAKDFFLGPYQVYEARIHGADAVLLIVAALTDAELRELRELVSALGLAALVEVHDEEGLARALDARADLIGINNRNLHSFAVDLSVTETLARRVPAGIPRVAESGIKGPEEVHRLAACGVDAMLVGEALMRAGDVEEATRHLVQAGRPQSR
jgi:indole-3-glycerol phosphate synthase